MNDHTVPPEGLYTPVVRFGTNLAYFSGAGPYRDDGTVITGRMGTGPTIAEGQSAASRCAAQLLSRLKAELGTLDRIKRCVKMTVFVQATEDFHKLTAVADGASQYLRDQLGPERSALARTTVGVQSLSDDYLCEIELLVQLYE